MWQNSPKMWCKFTTFNETLIHFWGYFWRMARFVRKRQLVDTETGEEFLSDERISVFGRAAWDRGRFVKVFIPGLEALVGLRPSEVSLVVYIMTKLRSGSRVIQVDFQGYSDWCELVSGKRPDRSLYHKALKGLSGLGWVVKCGKEWLINHHMAFVGDRSKHLLSITGKIPRLDETIGE